VLQFYNEAGDVVTIRPSGTEPKIKFYFGIKGSDADAKNEVLRAQFSK
jgi:phosphoglucomutase